MSESNGNSNGAFTLIDVSTKLREALHPMDGALPQGFGRFATAPFCIVPEVDTKLRMLRNSSGRGPRTMVVTDQYYKLKYQGNPDIEIVERTVAISRLRETMREVGLQ